MKETIVFRDDAHDNLIKMQVHTVDIGGRTWMADDLAMCDGTIVDRVKIMTHTDFFYTWDAAVWMSDHIVGWHLPTPEEWDDMVRSFGYEEIGKLSPEYRSYEGIGKLIDGAGFRYDRPGGLIDDKGNWNHDYPSIITQPLYFWTSKLHDDGRAYYRTFNTEKETSGGYYINWNYKMFVRLVKDLPA